MFRGEEIAVAARNLVLNLHRSSQELNCIAVGVEAFVAEHDVVIVWFVHAGDIGVRVARLRRK